MTRLPDRMALMLATLALTCGWAMYSANAQRIQTGLIPEFPYVKCDRVNGAYRFAPVVNSLGGGKYCFTIKVQNCSLPCCSSDLHKIEFEVSNSCLVQPAAVVTATVNGVTTRVRPSYDRPNNGLPGSAVLKITQLGLNPVTAADAEVCIQLNANRPGQGCTTLEQLCPARGGNCLAAFFDTACDCCPISPPTTPPPAPTPPSSPFPFGRDPCEVIITATLTPPSYTPSGRRHHHLSHRRRALLATTPSYVYDNTTCAAIQANISSTINGLAAEYGVRLKAPFIGNSTFCSPLTASVIGTIDAYNTTEEDQARKLFYDAVVALLPSLLEVAGGGACRPELDGYTVTISSPAVCFPLFQAAPCAVPPPPFPNCTCNTTENILPFTVLSSYIVREAASPANAEYCFSIATIPLNQVVPSPCGVANDALTKVEWLAEESARPVVRGFTLYNSTGSGVVKVSASWGPPGSQVLKVTRINWNAEQANGGLICVEIKKPATMADVCIGNRPAQCFLRLFNSNKDCCPVYPSSP